MIERPVWSTWARYKTEINESRLIEFANEIVANGFEDGQFEIDDYWEVLEMLSPHFKIINALSSRLVMVL